MFEAVEIGAKVSKKEFEEAESELRVGLVNAQYDLREAGFPVLIQIAGDDRLGCEQAIDFLHEWMDARYLKTRVFGAPSDEERQRPLFWRYWRELPPKGVIGLFYGSWTMQALVRRIGGEHTREVFEQRLRRSARLEQMLIADGALLLKFWLHIPKHELASRLKKAKRGKGEHWRVEEVDWDTLEVYDDALAVVAEALPDRADGGAPWTLVESTDARHRDLTLARSILEALEARLAEQVAASSGPAASTPEQSAAAIAPERSVLDTVDLNLRVAKEQYYEELAALQARLATLSRRAAQAGRSSVFAFEGWDAAGKGGSIRRMTRAMSAMDYRVLPIAAPTDEEAAQHYLWRFWRRLPRAGCMAIFDRSWYGRVLVERVEGFARDDEWRRAYAEINDFEEQLVEHGTAVAKFWLHIDPEEQLRRFELREKTSYKKYKITDEDYRNRAKWNDYVVAIDEMVRRTSTADAPWILVPANDKRVARLTVLRNVCERLEGVLG